MEDLIKSLTRGEKLLVIAAIEVDTMENAGSGRNTVWAERVDLVLEGRKGLFDLSDDELSERLLENELVLIEGRMPFPPHSKLETKEAIVLWARQISRIDAVDADKKSWESVPPDLQKAWLIGRDNIAD